MPRSTLLAMAACAVLVSPEMGSAQLPCAPESLVSCDVVGAAALRPSLRNDLLWAPPESPAVIPVGALYTVAPQAGGGSWWTPGRILVIGAFGAGAILGMTYAWGDDADDPDSFRSSTNVFQGALLGVALVGVGALALMIAGES